jgi:hypothetical protein
LYDLGTSTTLESNKSQAILSNMAFTSTLFPSFRRMSHVKVFLYGLPSFTKDSASKNAMTASPSALASLTKLRKTEQHMI